VSRRKEISIALQSDKPVSDYGELAALVEGYGFDMLSIYGDLMFQPPVVALTAAALATSRIRLGPASLNPYTLHPVEIAGQVASLDLASNGRAYWGISRGAWLDSIGIAQDRPISRIRETIDIVEHLLAGKREPFNGVCYTLAEHHALNYDVQRRHVPLLIGSWGPKLIRVAGERAAEVKIGGSTNPDVVPVVAGWLREGRQDTACGIVLGAVTIVDEDRDLARTAIRREMALYLPIIAKLDPTVEIDPELVAKMDTLVTQGDQEAAGKLIPDKLLNRFSFAGNPADIIEQSEALFAAGVSRIEFGTPHGVTGARGINLLGKQVLPALRQKER
jgi:5,10-methylenetetrahydromethanopterin reductase